MPRIFRIPAVAAIFLVVPLACPVRGGQVSYVGQEDDVTHFRTTTVPKAFDTTGTNVYGTAGYVTYTVDVPPPSTAPVFTAADPLTFDNGEFRTLSSVPSYLSLASNGQDYAVGGFGYPLIDDPTATPGPSVPQLQSGLALNNFVPIGTEASVLNIVIGSGAPAAGFRVGVMLIGSGEDAMETTRLTQTGGAGDGSASATRIGTPDTYFQFFDITGASAGDQFTLYLTKADSGFNPNVDYMGLTFDNLAAVPEPSSLALTAIGGLSGLGIWRRKRAAARRLPTGGGTA